MNKSMNKGQKIFYIAAVFVLPLLLLIAESSITINQVELALNYFTLPMLCHWLVGCACALYAGLLLYSGYKYRDKAVGLCALLSALLLLLCNIFSYAEGANVALHSLPFSIQVVLSTEFTLSGLFTTMHILAGILLLRKPSLPNSQTE